MNWILYTILGIIAFFGITTYMMGISNRKNIKWYVDKTYSEKPKKQVRHVKEDIKK